MEKMQQPHGVGAALPMLIFSVLSLYLCWAAFCSLQTTQLGVVQYTDMVALCFFTTFLAALSFGFILGHGVAIPGGFCFCSRSAMVLQFLRGKPLLNRRLMDKSHSPWILARRVVDGSISLLTARVFLPANRATRLIFSCRKDYVKLVFLGQPGWAETTNLWWEAMDVSRSKPELREPPHRPKALTHHVSEEAPPESVEEIRRATVRDRIDQFEKMILSEGTQDLSQGIKKRKRKKEDWVKTVLDRLQGLSSELATM